MGETYQVTLTEEEYNVLKEQRKEQALRPSTKDALKERKVVKKPNRVKYAGNTYTEYGELKVVEEAIKPKLKVKKGGFTMVIDSAMMKLATMDLQGRDYQVLFYMLSKLKYDNLVSVPQKEIAKELGMKQPEVSKSIGNLMAYGLLEEVKTGTPYKAYRLNALYFVKGHGPIIWFNQGLDYPPPQVRGNSQGTDV